MLEEVYPRIPTLQTGDDTVNADLNINEEVHKQYLVTCEALSQYLEKDAKRFGAIKKLNNAMEQIILKKVEAKILELMQSGDFTKRTEEEQLLVKSFTDNSIIKPLIEKNLALTNDQRSDFMRQLLSHLLSDTLSANELSNNFSLGNRGERKQAVTYLGFIEPDVFRAQLVAGRQWKDPTVPFGHGEFTHRIQWYMIIQELAPPQQGWLKFYQWVGKWRHAKQLNTDPAEKIDFWLKLGLWDALTDRNKSDRANANGPYNTKDSKDFGSPENLHPYLMSADNKDNWLVHAFITAREKNRAPMFETDRDGILTKQAVLARGQYLARKLYGSPLEQLDQKMAHAIAYYMLGIWNPYPILEPKDIAKRKQKELTEGKVWFESKLNQLQLDKQNKVKNDSDLTTELIVLEGAIAADIALESLSV
jgi:hypothetical protein